MVGMATIIESEFGPRVGPILLIIRNGLPSLWDSSLQKGEQDAYHWLGFSVKNNHSIMERSVS